MYKSARSIMASLSDVSYYSKIISAIEDWKRYRNFATVADILGVSQLMRNMVDPGHAKRKFIRKKREE